MSTADRVVQHRRDRAPRRHRVVTDSVTLAARNVVQQFFSYARGLILPRLLGPAHFGTVATVLLVERYSTFVSFGVHTATLYKAPELLATGRDREAKELNDTVVGFSFLTGCLASVALVVWALASRARLSSELFTGVLIASVLPPLITMRGAVLVWARVNGQFAKLARAGMLSALGLLVFTVGFGWRWNSSGVIAGYALGYLILIGYLFAATGSAMTVALQPRIILESLRLSVPVYLILGSLQAYQMTVDRLTIVRLLDVEHVGYYAIGQSMVGIMALVPAAVSEAIAPSLIAMTGAIREASRHLRRGTYVLALLMTSIAAVLIAIVPGVMRLVFPRYEPGIPVTQVLACAAYFDAVGVGSHYVVISGGRLKSYISYTAVLAGVAFFAVPIVCRGAGIVGVAVAMVGLTAARTLWTMWTANRLTGASRRDTTLTLLGLIGLGAAGMMAGWLALTAFSWPDGAGRYAILGVTLLRGAVALGCVGVVTVALGRANGYRLREAFDFVKATGMIPFWQ